MSEVASTFMEREPQPSTDAWRLVERYVERDFHAVFRRGADVIDLSVPEEVWRAFDRVPVSESLAEVQGRLIASEHERNRLSVVNRDLRDTLAVYRSVLLCGEPESPRLQKMYERFFPPNDTTEALCDTDTSEEDPMAGRLRRALERLVAAVEQGTARDIVSGVHAAKETLGMPPT